VNTRFKLLKKCGSGGTGEVYEALDLRLKRKVALKRARRDARGDHRERAARLVREAEILALVQHPNVVAIHDLLEEEDSVSIVMELVDGIPLGELYKKQPMSEGELLGYLRQLIAAVERVHSADIIHRDVNPRNVLVTPEGIVKLTDFGLSSSIHDPEPRAGGSLGYMAPEALRRGRRLGFGVDIYGLGMLAYQALLGAPAFQKLYGTVKPMAWARWLLSRERFRTLVELFVPVSPALSVIVAKMLEKDPKLRYQRITEVEKDIDKLGTRVDSGPSRGPSLGAAVRRLLPALLARPQEKSP